MKLTAFNGGMKGKIAGTVFQGGRYGQVCKGLPLIDAIAAGAKLTKADAIQVIPWKKSFNDAGREWRTLAAAAKLTWETGAINFPATNKFGDTYTPSGFQVFMTVNTGRLNAGLTIIPTCPAVGAPPAVPTITVVWDAGNHAYSLSAFTQTANCTYTLYATSNISPGAKPKFGDWKALYILANPETFPLNFTSAYEDVFGSAPDSGNIWFRVQVINNVNAVKGVYSLFQLTY